MTNITPIPNSNLEIFYHIPSKEYTTHLNPYWIKINNNPARQDYQISTNFTFEDELEFFDLWSKGATLQNSMGQKFHFYLKHFKKMLESKNEGKYLNPAFTTGEIHLGWRGKFSFKSMYSNVYCVML